MNEFEKQITTDNTEGLYAKDLDIIQVNIGLKCNQHCKHCHVGASPQRTEMMGWDTMLLVVRIADQINAQIVDITGGAPELHSRFRDFVTLLRQKSLRVQVRTNLTALQEEGMETMPEFLRQNRVELVASMPCYLAENVNAQRGEGAYRRSIEALRRLNQLGYGVEKELVLNLVYNPGGPFLPPQQVKLEEDYRRQLKENSGVTFTRLLTITNMPIGRFQKELQRNNQEQQYMTVLRDALNPQTLDGLMCRHQLSIGWDGSLFDCDFNLALQWPVNHGAPDHIRKFEATSLRRRRIVTGDHCFGCTAGAGSSCGGALA
jgi:radical SAM/Cys-rich protein